MKLALKILAGLLGLVVLGACGFYGYIETTWDQDLSAVPKPALKASTDPEVVRRGEYIVHSVAHCSICHVPPEVTAKRQPGEHPAMAGGYEWKMGPVGTLRSRNITPDPETGIGNWTDEELARAIKLAVGRDGKQLTFMSMSCPPLADEDVVAVVSYLRSQPPVKNRIDPHEVGFLGKWMATKVGPDFRRPFLERLTYAPPSDEPSAARGEYLARGPGWCVGCHTGFNMLEMRLEGPDFAGNAMAEPDHEDETMEYVAPNLTPDPETGHITAWDEDQFVRRFQAGRVLKTSKMPWEAFREMTESDLRSIYRYLRSLPPTKNPIGPTHRKVGTQPGAAAAPAPATTGQVP